MSALCVCVRALALTERSRLVPPPPSCPCVLVSPPTSRVQLCAKLRIGKAAVMGQSLGALFALRCARDEELKEIMEGTTVCLVSPWVPLAAPGAATAPPPPLPSYGFLFPERRCYRSLFHFASWDRTFDAVRKYRMVENLRCCTYVRTYVLLLFFVSDR